MNRAWVVVGMALRFAQALGLHVRNEDPTASSSKREVLVRIWWSLYSLDRQLSIITGRPSVIVDSTCSVTLPIPLSEEQLLVSINSNSKVSREGSSAAVSAKSSLIYGGPQPMGGVEIPQASADVGRPEANSGSYFKAVVQMATITQAILSSLYSASTVVRSQGELQHEISQLSQRLDNWVALLPVEFDFQKRGSPDVDTPGYRQRVLLGFQFYGARILLTRPCLGRMGQSGRDGRTPTGSPSFLQGIALMCVEAAKAELDLLPDQPIANLIYQCAPWWSCVHHLTQAIASLLLALSSPLFTFQDLAVLASYAKKAIRWLRSMYDVLAYRAYLVAMNAYQVVATRLSLDMTDLWNEHAMTYPNVDPTVVGEADVSQMDFATSFADTPPILHHERYDRDIAMSLHMPPIPAFVSCEPVTANFTHPLQPNESNCNDMFYRRPG
jgi:hypothetical protein